MLNFKAIAVGIANHTKPNKEVEELARERYETACKGCPFFIEETNVFFKIKDTRIVELNEMQCGDCGCELPYKLRQSIEKCEKWKR